jgi:hypothetical protein
MYAGFQALALAVACCCVERCPCGSECLVEALALRSIGRAVTNLCGG